MKAECFLGFCFLVISIIANPGVVAGKCLSGFINDSKNVIEVEHDPFTFFDNQLKKKGGEALSCDGPCVKFLCYSNSSDFIYGINCIEAVNDICNLNGKYNTNLVSFWKSSFINFVSETFILYKCEDSRCKKYEREEQYAQSIRRFVAKVIEKEADISSTLAPSTSTPTDLTTYAEEPPITSVTMITFSSTSIPVPTASTPIQHSPQDSTAAEDSEVEDGSNKFKKNKTHRNEFQLLCLVMAAWILYVFI